MSKVFDFSFTLAVEDIQAEPKVYSLKALNRQLVDITERFKLVALSSFCAEVSVNSDAKAKAIWIRGVITADLIQQCVVTLGDVPEQIEENFELMLVSPEMAEKLDENEVYLDAEAPDYDAFEGSVLPIGEIVAQTLSVLMDPYPKQQGAEIKVPNGQGVSVNENLEEKPNPFSVLSKLRDKS